MPRSDFETASKRSTYRKRIRSRWSVQNAGYSSYAPLNPGDGWVHYNYTPVFGSHELCIDSSWKYGTYRSLAEMHGDPRSYMRNFDLGGPLWVERVTLSLPTLFVEGLRTPVVDGRYGIHHGYLYPGSKSWSLSSSIGKDAPNRLASSGFTLAELLTLGTEGINRCLPDVPPFDIYQYFGELREGLPRLPGGTFLDYDRIVATLKSKATRSAFRSSKELWDTLRRRFRVASVGSEYLNWVFGVGPTASMASDLFAVGLDPSILDAGPRDFNREVRRRRTLMDEKSTTVSIRSEGAVPSFNVSGGTVEEKVELHRKVWISCAFNYLPARAALRRANSSLLGYALQFLRADTLWELSPYSWLLDYFANVGTVLTNLTHMQRQGIGLSYAYLMAETTRTTTWTWSGKLLSRDVTTQQVLTEQTKQRIRANPFGFGLKGNLSPSQLAILAALGLSKVVGKTPPT